MNRGFWHLMIWIVCEDMPREIAILDFVPVFNVYHVVIEMSAGIIEFEINPDYVGYQGSFKHIKAEMTRHLDRLIERQIAAPEK